MRIRLHLQLFDIHCYCMVVSHDQSSSLTDFDHRVPPAASTCESSEILFATCATHSARLIGFILCQLAAEVALRCHTSWFMRDSQLQCKKVIRSWTLDRHENGISPFKISSIERGVSSVLLSFACKSQHESKQTLHFT